MQEGLVFLDQYVLQKDMRIRLPKSILENLHAVRGETLFSIYLDQENNQLILRIANKPEPEQKEKNA